MKRYIGVGLFFLLWQMAAMLCSVPIFPSPLAVLACIWVNPAKPLIHCLYSLLRLLAGSGLAVLAGFPLGILLGYFPKADAMFSPLAAFLAPVPKIALLPVIMLCFGVGNASKVFIIFIIIVFQVITAVHDGVRNSAAVYGAPLLAARAGHWQMIRHVAVPAALPELFTAMRVGLATGVSALFFAETFGTRQGLGFYVMDMWMRLDYTAMYGGIALLGILGLVASFAVSMGEKRLCPWNNLNNWSSLYKTKQTCR